MGVSVTLASYNILNEYQAVKWGTEAGLSMAGKEASRAELDEALSQGAWKAYSNWEERLPFLAENIQQAAIICLQEVNQDRLEDILEYLQGEDGESQYAIGSQAFPQNTDELASKDPGMFYGNVILYRKTELKLLDAGHHPEDLKVNSGRVAAMAEFQLADKILRVMSCHLAGYWRENPDTKKKEQSQRAGWDQLKAHEEYLRSLPQDHLDALVIAGDFNEDNCEASSPLYRVGYLRDRGYLDDVNEAVTEPEKEARIDFVMVKPLQSPVELAPLYLESFQIGAASDHLMTGTRITFA